MPHLLKHRYQILRVLSEAGGFCQTFLAEITDVPSRRRCVIKKLRPIDDPEDFKLAQDRFQREAAVLERLGDSCDQIPKLYAYFVEEQEFYLVQEYVEGPTLRQMVRQGTPLGERAVRGLLVDLLGVLAYVHGQNVIHRDIKPDNVILRQRDNRPVLLDFGIVKEVLRAGGDRSPMRSIMAGTPGYVSLEQAAGCPSFASDLYSLGATGIFLLTGKNPQSMTDPATGKIRWRQYAPEVSPTLAAILDKSTEAYVRDRYQTAKQMRQDLREVFRVDARVGAPPPSITTEEETVVRAAAPSPPTPESRQRGYALYLGIAAAVVGLLTAIGSAAVSGRLDVRSRAGSVVAKGESSSRKQGVPAEKQRQGFVNRATTAEATRVRTSATPALATPTPAERPQARTETVDACGIFPEASTRLLTAHDLAGRSPWELRVMRNEIFARHGYIFKTPEMHSYFARQQWYIPLHDDVSRFLSDIEVQNAEMIKKVLTD